MRAKSGQRIASVCVAAFPGPNRTLAWLAEASGLVRHFALADERPGGRQAKFLMAHLETIHPQIVIFGGWSRHYEAFLASPRRRGPRYVVYWTSSAGQTETSGELEWYLRILDDDRIAQVLYVDAALAASPAAHRKAASVLPICWPPHLGPAAGVCSAAPLPVGSLLAAKSDRLLEERRLTHAKRRGPKVISFFISPVEAKRKNAFNTLLALAGLKDYVLHLNGLSRDPIYRRLLTDLKIPFQDFGWMERDAYERAVDEVDLGLQVSFAESYNQVVADHFLRGIPVVVSAMVPSLKNVAPALRNEIAVANPDDPSAIRQKIGRLLGHPLLRERVGTAVRRQLVADNAANVRVAKRVLRSL
jgi:hypothetical protein